MRQGMVGRIALALLVSCVLGGALYWGFLRNQDAEANGTRVELDVSRLENGAAPSHFDTGQSAVISQNPDDPGANLVVRDGKLTFDPTTDGVAAAYYSSPDMDGPITGLGARWVFRPRTDDAAAISLVVSGGTRSEESDLVPPVPAQLVVTPINWNLSIKKDNASPLSPVAAGNFDTPLAVDGTTVYETSVSIDGSRVTINLPDGEHRNVNDARIAQWQGHFAAFGLYSNNGLLDSVGGFEKIWATSVAGNK